MTRAGKHSESSALADKAVSLLEILVNQEGKADLSMDLAKAYSAKTKALQGLKQESAALEYIDRAVDTAMAWFQTEQRDDVLLALADYRMRKTEILSGLGRVTEAREVLTGTISLIRNDSTGTHQKDLDDTLVVVQRHMTNLS